MLQSSNRVRAIAPATMYVTIRKSNSPLATNTLPTEETAGRIVLRTDEAGLRVFIQIHHPQRKTPEANFSAPGHKIMSKHGSLTYLFSLARLYASDNCPKSTCRFISTTFRGNRKSNLTQFPCATRLTDLKTLPSVVVLSISRFLLISLRYFIS